MSAINRRFDEQRDIEIKVPMEDKEAALSSHKQRLNDTDYMLVQKNGDKVKEIDLVVDEGNPLLMEIEVIEPSLYFNLEPKSANLFAKKVSDFFNHQC